MGSTTSLILFCMVFHPCVVVAQISPPVSHERSADAVPIDMIQIQGIRITGNAVVGTEELAPIVGPYTGRFMRLAELQQVADRIIEEYRARGYNLAKAYLPPQEVQDGVVEIAVLEGKLGEIIVEGNRHYSESFIRKGFSQVRKEGAIRQTTLEQSLLLLNEYPNLNVMATLEPGEAPGTTTVRAAVTDTRPIHVTLDYNNFGIPFISRNRFGAGIDVANVLVEGSRLNIDGFIGDNPDRLLFILGSYAMPLNHRGTRLILSGSDGRFDVGGQLASLTTFRFRIPSSRPGARISGWKQDLHPKIIVSSC